MADQTLSELLPIQQSSVGGQAQPTISARRLHAFLGIKKDVTDWIKAQIKRARLKEDKDFIVFPQKGENGGRPSMEYFLTIEAAKHIAMMSGSEKGYEAREYFLECERIVIQSLSAPGIALPPEIHLHMLRTSESLDRLAAFSVEFKAHTDQRFDRIETRLEALEESAKATSKRRPFGATALREWNGVLLMRYDGRCPCCQETRIVDAFGRPLEGVYEADHWRSPSHNKVSDGWPVCRTCNRQVLESDRLAKQYAFQHFHSLRKSIYRHDADRAIEQLGFFAAESA